MPAVKTIPQIVISCANALVTKNYAKSLNITDKASLADGMKLRPENADAMIAL
jgi:alpha-D-ribose 1-methylphosphonate 5-triphosphate diphosphatase PhnM